MNTRNTNRKGAFTAGLLVVAALSGSMLSGVTQAAAIGDDSAPQQAVMYKDLDLQSKAGVQALYHRIQGAANQVCGKVDERDLEAKSAKDACVKHAVSEAVATVNSQTLTQVHFAKTGISGQQMLTVAQVR
jgi:UrcA family protein